MKDFTRIVCVRYHGPTDTKGARLSGWIVGCEPNKTRASWDYLSEDPVQDLALVIFPGKVLSKQTDAKGDTYFAILGSR